MSDDSEKGVDSREVEEVTVEKDRVEEGRYQNIL